jgi:transposase
MATMPETVSRDHAAFISLQHEVRYLKDQNQLLLEQIQSRDRIIAGLRSDIAIRDARIHELERRCRLDSSNSSKPPSSDALSKPEAKDQAKRKPGAKRGHPGTTRKDFGEPDRVEDLVPHACDGCGHDLTGLPVLPGHRHQVAEWVAKPIEITEYHHQQRVCPCCRKRVEAPYPTHILPGSRLGPRLIAHLVLFNRWGHMSLEKLERLLNDDFGLPITRKSISNAFARVHDALQKPYGQLARLVPLAPRLNVDETGWRIEGKRFNIWTFSTPAFSYLTVAKTRGRAILDEVVGPDYRGVIMCDFFAAYDRYLTQRCLAHLSRDLKSCIESPDNDCRAFATEALGYIHDAWDCWKSYQAGGASLLVYQEKGRTIQAECRRFLETLPVSLPRYAAILRKRFFEDWDSLWHFLVDPQVMPHNNDAERSLRPIVTLRKMTGGSRSVWGAALSATIHSILGTCRKQGTNAHQVIVQALIARAHPGCAYPILVPTPA